MPLRNLEKRTAYKKAWAQRNRERLTELAREWRKRNLEKCRAQARERSRKWYAANREKALARSAARRAVSPEKARAACRRWSKSPAGLAYARAAAKRWRLENPERSAEIKAMTYQRTRERIREKNLKFFYGISLEDYQKLLTDQAGRCASCRVEFAENFSSKRRANVDHSHQTGKVRGLLCNACNRAAGLLGDDPALLESLAAYLRRADGVLTQDPPQDETSAA